MVKLSAPCGNAAVYFEIDTIINADNDTSWSSVGPASTCGHKDRPDLQCHAAEYKTK